VVAQPISTEKESNNNKRPKPCPQKDPVNDALGETRQVPVRITTALLVWSITPANSGLQHDYFRITFRQFRHHLCALYEVY